MASDTSLIFNLIAKDKVTKALGPIAGKLNSFGTGIGKAVAGVGVAAPHVAAASAAALSLAAAGAAAGAGVGAFAVAVAPQMTAVTDAMTAYEATLDNVGQSEDAVKKETEAYTAALKDMPPHTRAVAQEMIKLKASHEAWSNNLAKDTMPIFTRGILAARMALPALTPLVTAASGAFSEMMDDISRGVQSNGFHQWIQDLSATAGPVLMDLWDIGKNVFSGLLSIIHAFLPGATGVTGGLVSMSAAFREWAGSIEGSTGFQKFKDFLTTSGPMLANLGTAITNLVASMAPFMGTTLIIATAFAQLIAATPVDWIVRLGQAFIVASVALKAYHAVMIVVRAATAAWAAIQAVLNASLWANPIGVIVLAIIALIAVIVLAYKKNETFRKVVQAVWAGTKVIIGAVVNWIKANVPPAWQKITAAAKATWNWIRGAWGAIKTYIVRPFQDAASRAKALWRSVTSYFSGLRSRFAGIGRGIVSGLWGGLRGAWNGMVGWLQGKIAGLSGIAKKILRIGSPSKVWAGFGEALPDGLTAGFQRRLPAARAVVQAGTESLARSPGGPTVGSPGVGMHGGRDVWEVQTSGDPFGQFLAEMIKRYVRRRGGGNVQAAFGG